MVLVKFLLILKLALCNIDPWYIRSFTDNELKFIEFEPFSEIKLT
jgi:hypothetical protein